MSYNNASHSPSQFKYNFDDAVRLQPQVSNALLQQLVIECTQGAVWQQNPTLVLIYALLTLGLQKCLDGM